MRFLSRVLPIAALACVALAPAAHAQITFFPTNTTLNASNPVTLYAIIGYANQADYFIRTNPTSPTVNLVSGGSVGGYLQANNSSILNISGGSVSSTLYAIDNSTVNVSGGSVGNGLYVENNATLNLSGGSIRNLLGVENNATLNLFGTGQTAILVNPDDGFYRDYLLSGTLSDGTRLVNIILSVQNGSNARFTLNNVAAVPEPGSIALLAGMTLTGAAFLSRRRSRRTAA